MYSVIEYYKLNSTNPNKEVAIHYYTNNKHKAVSYICKLANEHKTYHHYDYVMDVSHEDDINHFIQAYTSINQYVKLLTCVKLDDNTNELLEQSNQKTLEEVMKAMYGIELIDKYEDIKDQVVEFIPMSKLIEICSEMAYYSKKGCFISDKIFAVIELQELC